MKWMAASAVLLLLGAQDDVKIDRTGMDWVLPFKEARKKAEKENRILLIKPIAFGTSADGGW